MSVIMEETSAQKKQEKKLTEKLLKKTNFSLLEIEKLLFTYRKTVVHGFQFISTPCHDVHEKSVNSVIL